VPDTFARAAEAAELLADLPPEPEELLVLSAQLLDEQLLDLLISRAAVEAQLRHCRRASGRPEGSFSYENQVIQRYSARFGKPGVRVALAFIAPQTSGH
jgi:hypothetical protein